MTSTTAHHPTRDTAPVTTSLEESFAWCHRVSRSKARNFYYGMKLTPEPKRSAMYAIYAWMRMADDLADGAGDLDEKTRRIEAFRRHTHAAVLEDGPLPDEPMWPAVRQTLRDYDIPLTYLDDMIEGQLLDQRKTTYRTFEELYDYCYKVASVVGLVCLQVWGYRDGQATLKMAEQRGIALQLTNILRDVAEDASRGRVYLPQEDLEAFHVTPADLASRKPGPAFTRLMQFEVQRAMRYYEQSQGLEEHLDASCRATSWAMMRIYRGLLDKIAAEPQQVLRQRIRLSSLQKLFIGMRATLGA